MLSYDDEMDYSWDRLFWPQGLRYQPVFRDDVSDKHEDRASTYCTWPQIILTMGRGGTLIISKASTNNPIRFIIIRIQWVLLLLIVLLHKSHHLPLMVWAMVSILSLQRRWFSSKTRLVTSRMHQLLLHHSRDTTTPDATAANTSTQENRPSPWTEDWV